MNPTIIMTAWDFSISGNTPKKRPLRSESPYGQLRMLLLGGQGPLQKEMTPGKVDEPMGGIALPSPRSTSAILFVPPFFAVYELIHMMGKD